MPNNNKTLNNAQKNKFDEFYTSMTDVEDEIVNYFDQLRNKIIYCNTDTEKSNFVKVLRLLEDVVGFTVINSSTDFRLPENIELLKTADVVITNPPFSLFREYTELLFKHNKKFIIMGNNNAVTYKDLFSRLKKGELTLGYQNGGNKWFETTPGFEIGTKRAIERDGKLYCSFGNICWYTNLEVERKDLELTATYNSVDYPVYSNYEAIEVSKIKAIPKDYNGAMGVPITIMSKYNPTQFKILDLFQCPVLNGRNLYKRIIIQKV